MCVGCWRVCRVCRMLEGVGGFVGVGGCVGCWRVCRCWKVCRVLEGV